MRRKALGCERLTMRRATTASAVLGVVLGLHAAAFALDAKKAQYVGGTLSLAAETEGVFNTENEDKLIFFADNSFETIQIPYAKIDTLEYGQKASRAVLKPWTLFHKKRRHYLSVSFKDKDNKDQAAVFELGKDILRPTVLVIQVRSHKKVQFQNEEARKHFGG
jgi:hypothetical protein